MIFEDMRKRRDGYCTNFHYGYVKCRNGYDCIRCTLGDSIREENIRKYSEELLFTDRDVRSISEKAKGDVWWHYPVVLSPEVMAKLGLELNIVNQIAIASSGSGVFPRNPVGMLDIYLYSNPQKRFTITRNEAYGIPNDKAVSRYDELFFWDLKKLINKLDNQKGVWCL